MGLGPPVCLDCRRIQDPLPNNVRVELIKKGINVCSGWWCSECKGYNFKNEKGFSDSTMNSSHLYELSKEDIKEFCSKRKKGGNMNMKNKSELKFESNFTIMPADCNYTQRVVFGGTMLAQMDITAAACVARLLRNSETAESGLTYSHD